MRINADFAKNALVVPSQESWVHSPENGVDRLMLDRIGDEVARATSVVRYAAGSHFASHIHARGEEFLVLEGVFSDESGHYPRGTYVRNPPGSSHAPYSEEGCRILVKLRQFDSGDSRQVVIDTAQADGWRPQPDGASERLHLHQFGSECVAMLRVGAGQRLPVMADPGGVEIFLVTGSLRSDDRTLPVESWLRYAPGAEIDLRCTTDALLWIKSGHLAGAPDAAAI
jgi:hypothetical protein